uniref:Uncharacterized protein n=1 Tax=Anguilla anguilla TaxID=7936 RepID=A0A0E9VGC3_ANGAN
MVESLVMLDRISTRTFCSFPEFINVPNLFP